MVVILHNVQTFGKRLALNRAERAEVIPEMVRRTQFDGMKTRDWGQRDNGQSFVEMLNQRPMLAIVKLL